VVVLHVICILLAVRFFRYVWRTLSRAIRITKRRLSAPAVTLRNTETSICLLNVLETFKQITDLYRLNVPHYFKLKIKFILVIVKEDVTCFKVSEGIAYIGADVSFTG